MKFSLRCILETSRPFAAAEKCQLIVTDLAEMVLTSPGKKMALIVISSAHLLLYVQAHNCYPVTTTM